MRCQAFFQVGDLNVDFLQRADLLASRVRVFATSTQLCDGLEQRLERRRAVSFEATDLFTHIPQRVFAVDDRRSRRRRPQSFA